MGRLRLYFTNAERQRAYRKRLRRSVHFRSATSLWSTPQALFDELNSEFQFTLDVCAVPGNAKCSVYFTPAEDGLNQEWSGPCWMNPPYGNGISASIRKAYESSQAGALGSVLKVQQKERSW
jgi:phage N-6-adenine-methyltransferase